MFLWAQKSLWVSIAHAAFSGGKEAACMQNMPLLPRRLSAPQLCRYTHISRYVCLYVYLFMCMYIHMMHSKQKGGRVREIERELLMLLVQDRTTTAKHAN